MPNYSTIMDPERVIYLGHKVKQPLIRSPSELSYGFEPHDLIYLRSMTVLCGTGAAAWAGIGVPGVGLGGCRVGTIPGTNLRPD